MIWKWYWIMPNKILFAKDLSDKQKILYVVISSLCAEKWHCWASNKYIWEKIWWSETRISKQISDMAKKWYIKVVVNRYDWNSRAIELQDKTIVVQNKTSWTTEQDPSWTTGQDNITSINITKEYKEDDELKNLFLDYLTMRKKIKKPASEKAIWLAIKKLENLSGWRRDIKIKILEQSILNSRQWLFAIKQEWWRQPIKHHSKPLTPFD